MEFNINDLKAIIKIAEKRGHCRFGIDWENRMYSRKDIESRKNYLD